MSELAPGARLNVLWATDGSDASHLAMALLRQAILPSASSLTVLTVAPHSFLGGARPDPSFLTRITPAARRRAMVEGEQTAEAEATLLDPPMKVAAVSRWGNPIEEILRAAKSFKSDLVVLGAKGHSDLGMLLLGSVAQGVIQHATSPVLIARTAPDSIRRVLVGYDGTPQARKGLDFLRRFKLPPNVSLTLACAVEPFKSQAAMSPTLRRGAADEATRIDENNTRAAEKALQTIAAQLAADGLTNVQTRILSGAPGVALDDASRELDADLIVVGSRRPSPARHYLLGSTAEKLVRHSPRSVLVVR